MATNFKTITAIKVKWTQHTDPKYAKVHSHINSYYSDNLPNHKRIYVVETDEDEVKPDNELRRMIRNIIATELIVPFAMNTPDAVNVLLLLNDAPMFVDDGTMRRRLTKATMTDALTRAVTGNKTYIEIQLGTGNMYFNDDAQPINYSNWTDTMMSNTAFPMTAPPVPLSASDIATAVATAMPAAPDATALASAFATAFTGMGSRGAPGSSATTLGGTPASGVTPPGPVSSYWTFNPAALPSDARGAWQNKNDGGLILGSKVRAKFASGGYYELDGSDRLVLKDGTLYIMQEPNEKELFRSPVCCDDDTYVGVRNWYNSFGEHLRSHGFYAHPFYCFRKDHGGRHGFTAGNDPDDDLPLRLAVPLKKMTQPIFRLLQKKDMFPKDSNLHKIVLTCYGDGFAALKAVLFKAHPIFYDQPSTLVTEYPKQRAGQSIRLYYMLFMDYLQLRAFIKDTNSTLDDEHELDVFINNALHSEFLSQPRHSR